MIVYGMHLLWARFLNFATIDILSQKIFNGRDYLCTTGCVTVTLPLPLGPCNTGTPYPLLWQPIRLQTWPFREQNCSLLKNASPVSHDGNTPVISPIGRWGRRIMIIVLAYIEDLRLAYVQPQEPTWWKERTDSLRNTHKINKYIDWKGKKPLV